MAESHFCQLNLSVLKVVKNIIITLLWTVLSLYTVLFVALRIPAFQNYLGSKAEMLASQKTGTKVTVGRVDIGLFNRIVLDNVTIFDQRQQVMLHTSRLSVKIELAPLANNHINILSAQLFGTRATLYRQTAETEPNYQFLIDALSSDDDSSDTPLHLRANSFIMRNASFRYDQFDVVPTPGKFNSKHININDISAHVVLKALGNDSLNLTVKRLSMNETSGINLDNLSFHLTADKRSAQLSDFNLSMPDTHLHIDSIHATYATYSDSIDTNSIKYFGRISNTYVTPSDLRAFFTPLKNYQKQVSIDALFSGTANSIDLQELQIKEENNDVHVVGNGAVSNIDKPIPSWHAHLDNLTLSDRFIDFITKAFTSIPPAVRRLGSVSLSGDFNGAADGLMTAITTITSGVGDVSLKLGYSRDRHFTGTIATQGIDLRQLTDDEHFGILAANTDVKGHLPNGGKPTISVKGMIGKFEYNDYPYTNMEVNGTYSDNLLSGMFTIDDPNLDASIEGLLSPKKVKVGGRVNTLRPQALHLTDRWGAATFSTDINADFTASNINNAVGSLNVSNFRMDSYSLNSLDIETGFDAGTHFIRLNSDFATAELTGDFDYRTLAHSIANAVGSKLPSLPALPQKVHTDNYFQLQLTMFKSDWLSALLDIPLELQQPLSLQALVNDRLHHISLEGDVPAFIYDGSQYQTGHVSFSSPADTMRCLVSISKVGNDGDRLDLALRASAASDRVKSTLLWDNNDQQTPMRGTLNAVTILSKDIGGSTDVNVSIQPSTTMIGPSLWDIEPSAISYSDKQLTVSNFSIRHDDQHIMVDGKASNHSHDSLTVDLSRVEVDYILKLVGFDAVDFNGEATGRAYIMDPLGQLSARGNLRVDHFLFEHGRMGTLFAGVEWNKKLKQIDINATANDGPDAMTYINGYVAPVSSDHHPQPFIDLGITAHGTHIDFMHSFTKSFISEVGGHAKGAVRLAGPLSDINLTGQLVVDGKATISTLGTTYELRHDTVTMIPDEIMLNRVPVYDRHDTKGYLSGGIHHKHLTRLTFDLYVDAENLLAYDFSDFGTQSFYGTVYATGNVGIHGRSGQVTIDCNVTPQKNTVFVYNASQTDAISDQSFITWKRHPTTLTERMGEDSANAVSPVEQDNAPTPSLREDGGGSDIFLNFTINATPDATMRLLMDAKTNDYIALRGNGSLRATYHNKGAFQMFGTYTVDNGTYDVTIQNIIHKLFHFQPGGTIVFGGDPYDAALALQAVYTVSSVSLSDLNIGNSFSSGTIRVNCLMNISGQPNAPQVTFDLEMPTVNADEQQMVRSVINGEQAMNQQVLYLLGIGRFYNQGQNNADMGQQDPTSIAMQSLLSGTLSNQLNGLLSQVIKNDKWNFGANISTGTEGWNNAEYEGIVNGRMLNNRLLINGQFGYRDNATRANPSFIGDFDIRYLLLPNGNLALKVYNQTNDRYFTHSSLNTQGIGVIMKKDFNGLRDLFHLKKNNKKEKNNNTTKENKQ